MNIKNAVIPVVFSLLLSSQFTCTIERLRPGKAPVVACDYTKRVKNVISQEVHTLQEKLLGSISLCSSWRTGGADKSKVLLLEKINELSVSLDNVRYILEKLSSQDFGELFEAMNKKVSDAIQCCCRADLSSASRFACCRKSLLELLHMKNVLFASFLPQSFKLSPENKSLCNAFEKFLGALDVTTVVDHDVIGGSEVEKHNTSDIVSKNDWDYAVNLKNLDITLAKDELKNFLDSYIESSKTSSPYVTDLKVRIIKIIDQLNKLSDTLIDAYTAREMVNNKIGYAVGGRVGSWVGSLYNWAGLRLSKKEQERVVLYGSAKRIISAIRSSLSSVEAMLKKTSPDFFDSKEMYEDFALAQKNGVADTFIKKVIQLKKKPVIQSGHTISNVVGYYKKYLKDLAEGSLKGAVQGVVAYAGQACDVVEAGINSVDRSVQKLDAKKLIEAFSRKDFAKICDTLQTVIGFLKYKPSTVMPYVAPFVASSYNNFSFMESIINQKFGKEKAQKAITLMQKYPVARYMDIVEEFGKLADFPVKVLSALVDSIAVYYKQNPEHVETFVLGLVNNVKAKMLSVNTLKNTVSTKKMELIFSFLTPKQRIECKEYFALVDKDLQKKNGESIFNDLSRQNFLQQPKVANTKKLDSYGLPKDCKKSRPVLSKNLNALLDQRSDVLRPKSEKPQVDTRVLRKDAYKAKINKISSIYESMLNKASADYNKKEEAYKKKLSSVQKKIDAHKKTLKAYKSTWRSFFNRILFRKSNDIAQREKELKELENEKKRMINSLQRHKNILKGVRADIARRSNDLQKGRSLEDAFKKASKELAFAKNAYVMMIGKNFNK